MIERRDFLKGLGLAAAGAAIGGCQCQGPCSRQRLYALQLYSIHKIFWKEPERILAALKAGGYHGVEFFNYNGMSAKALRKMCDDAGVKAMGTHLNGDVDLVGDALKRTLDFAAEAGFESLVTPHAKRDSADAYRKFGNAMGLAAEAADAYGIKVGVHSTYHHFTTLYGAETAWDMIYKEASPKLYQQIDTANTFHTGYDVVDLLKRYPNRHFSLHLKENVPACLGKPVAFAEDCMNADASLKWWIVEAEGRPDSLDPAIKCVAALRSWC